MLHCDNCKIDVGGAPERCPLCQNELTGTPDPTGGVFVPLPFDKKRQDFIFRLITLIAIGGALISLGIDYMVGRNISWSLFVIAGCACGWIFAAVGWRKKYQLSKNIFWQTVFVSVSGLFWDLILGWTGWSVDFIIPCACVAAIIAMAALAIIRRLPSNEYMIYLITVAVFGLIPAVLLFTGVVGVIYPSVICALLCLLALVTLFLFFRHNTLNELNKKLHL